MFFCHKISKYNTSFQKALVELKESFSLPQIPSQGNKAFHFSFLELHISMLFWKLCILIFFSLVRDHSCRTEVITEGINYILKAQVVLDTRYRLKSKR